MEVVPAVRASHVTHGPMAEEGQRLVNSRRPENAGSPKPDRLWARQAGGARWRQRCCLAGKGAVRLSHFRMKGAAWDAFKTKRINQPSSRVRLIKESQTKTGLGRQVVRCKTTIEKAIDSIINGKNKWEANVNRTAQFFDLYKQTVEAVDQAKDKLDYLNALQDQYTSIMEENEDDEA